MTRSICAKLINTLCLATAVIAFVALPAEAASRRAYCDAYARDVANRSANAGDVLAGTIGGALGGALIGAAIDKGKGAGRGAIIGGVAGTALGAAATSSKWERAYYRAFDNCMASSAVARQPVYAGEAPRPGTKAWYRYCSAKYRSFNPSTGMYTAYSGKQYPCQ
jgi:uncharacterized protein YcfJ